ncbi:MAG: hypothetical protein ACYC33_04055 [Thermoleophilia bacterium]
MMAGLDAAGHKLAGGANARLERAPIRVPAALLLAGVGLLVGAFVLSRLAAQMDPDARSHEVAWLVASVLYGGGGLSILVGLAGLLSALVVHIVDRRVQRRSRDPKVK